MLSGPVRSPAARVDSLRDHIGIEYMHSAQRESAYARCRPEVQVIHGLAQVAVLALELLDLLAQLLVVQDELVDLGVDGQGEA